LSEKGRERGIYARQRGEGGERREEAEERRFESVEFVSNRLFGVRKENGLLVGVVQEF
jgi:glutamate synthase domain-containing protein 2